MIRRGKILTCIHADLITPNLNELAKASGMPTNSDDEVITAARQIIQTAGIDAVLATRSEQGMSIITRHDVYSFESTC